MRVLWLVSLTQRLSRCLWTMVRPSRSRAPFGLQGGLITLLVRADRRVMRAHTMENLQTKVCNLSVVFRLNERPIMQLSLEAFHQQRIPSP